LVNFHLQNLQPVFAQAKRFPLMQESLIEINLRKNKLLSLEALNQLWAL
jgi:hypothetical protein